MTLQLPGSTRPPGVAHRSGVACSDVAGSDVAWKSPARGLWVATHRGEHAGMVECIDGVYYAHSARGRDLGRFDDLDSARLAVGNYPEPAPGARRVPTPLWAVNLVGAVVAVGLAWAVLR